MPVQETIPWRFSGNGSDTLGRRIIAASAASFRSFSIEGGLIVFHDGTHRRPPTEAVLPLLQSAKLFAQFALQLSDVVSGQPIGVILGQTPTSV